MLLAASALKVYSVETHGGASGAVNDQLFDDRTSQIKWLVKEWWGHPANPATSGRSNEYQTR